MQIFAHGIARVRDCLLEVLLGVALEQRGVFRPRVLRPVHRDGLWIHDVDCLQVGNSKPRVHVVVLHDDALCVVHHLSQNVFAVHGLVLAAIATTATTASVAHKVVHNVNRDGRHAVGGPDVAEDHHVGRIVRGFDAVKHVWDDARLPLTPIRVAIAERSRVDNGRAAGHARVGQVLLHDVAEQVANAHVADKLRQHVQLSLAADAVLAQLHQGTVRLLGVHEGAIALPPLLDHVVGHGLLACYPRHADAGCHRAMGNVGERAVLHRRALARLVDVCGQQVRVCNCRLLLRLGSGGVVHAPHLARIGVDEDATEVGNRVGDDRVAPLAVANARGQRRQHDLLADARRHAHVAIVEPALLLHGVEAGARVRRLRAHGRKVLVVFALRGVAIATTTTTTTGQRSRRVLDLGVDLDAVARVLRRHERDVARVELLVVPRQVVVHVDNLLQDVEVQLGQHCEREEREGVDHVLRLHVQARCNVVHENLGVDGHVLCHLAHVPLASVAVAAVVAVAVQEGRHQHRLDGIHHAHGARNGRDLVARARHVADKVLGRNRAQAVEDGVGYAVKGLRVDRRQCLGLDHLEHQHRVEVQQAHGVDVVVVALRVAAHVATPRRRAHRNVLALAARHRDDNVAVLQGAHGEGLVGGRDRVALRHLVDRHRDDLTVDRRRARGLDAAARETVLHDVVRRDRAAVGVDAEHVETRLVVQEREIVDVAVLRQVRLPAHVRHRVHGAGDRNALERLEQETLAGLLLALEHEVQAQAPLVLGALEVREPHEVELAVRRVARHRVAEEVVLVPLQVAVRREILGHLGDHTPALHHVQLAVPLAVGRDRRAHARAVQNRIQRVLRKEHALLAQGRAVLGRLLPVAKRVALLVHGEAVLQAHLQQLVLRRVVDEARGINVCANALLQHGLVHGRGEARAVVERVCVDHRHGMLAVHVQCLDQHVFLAVYALALEHADNGLLAILGQLTEVCSRRVVALVVRSRVCAHGVEHLLLRLQELQTVGDRLLLRARALRVVLARIVCVVLLLEPAQRDAAYVADLLRNEHLVSAHEDTRQRHVQDRAACVDLRDRQHAVGHRELGKGGIAVLPDVGWARVTGCVVRGHCAVVAGHIHAVVQ